MILDRGQAHTVIMDTTDTAGLPLENNRISAQLFAAGVNAGKGRITGTELTYNVKANPVYGLSVKADQGKNAWPRPEQPLDLRYHTPWNTLRRRK